ncbi:MAG: transcription termination factor NusA [Candidatus Omnitrophica bacterium]|nr:transcription termination factor NusA [Candidatus Omnitrophota bacterium]
MNEELLTILDQMEREKGIDKELLFKAIESALASAAKKIVQNKEAEVTAVIDRSTGQITIMSEGKPVKSAEFGRIAAQTAKRTIVNGSVHRFEKGDIVLDLGKTEAILPRSHQCQGERYKQGDRIRAYILEVNKTSHGPQVVLTRSDVAFVKKLFEIEVPEIMDGIVEIRSIAREPGERTKLAVWSKDEKVDAVGACVGMRGSRVKDIVNELKGERVDIVRWSDDIKEYVKAALSPAEPLEVTIDKANKRIAVTVADDQLSIGIGKHGQNVRLASRLIGWEIDIRGKEEKAKKAAEALLAGKPEDKKEAIGPEAPASKTKKAKTVKAKDQKKAFDLTAIKGIGQKISKILIAAGYDTSEKLKALTIEDLTKLEGVGEKTAEKILKAAKDI